MLKLNASYSKKVPAGEEYSSQSYHASVEVELPDGLARISYRPGFTKRSIWYETRTKRNCMENLPQITAVARLPEHRETVLNAAGQGRARMTLRQARNSFRICSTLPVSVA